MTKYIHEVLEEAAKAKNKADKVAILKENDSGALQDVLRGTFDDRIVWLLPDGPPPPYIPSKPESTASNLRKECTKLAFLVKGGRGPDLKPWRREQMFIGILEAIHPKDALLLIDMINKRAPEGVTKAVAKEAFPHLFP